LITKVAVLDDKPTAIKWNKVNFMINLKNVD